MLSYPDLETAAFTKLPTFAYSQAGCAEIVKVSSSEFLAVSQKTGSLYGYSSTDNRWWKLRHSYHNRRYPLRFMSQCRVLQFPKVISSVYVETQNRLFIADDQGSLMSIILRTGKRTTYPRCSVPIDSMLLIGGHIHMFGTQCSGHSRFQKPVLRHIIFDVVTSKFSIEEPRIMKQRRIWFHRAIFLKSRNSILMTCAVDKSDGPPRILVEYSLETSQYRTLEWSVTPGLVSKAMVSTLNERYIVIFGEFDDKITVYDLRKRTVATSYIKCPSMTYHKAVNMGSNLTVFGYIRREYESAEMRDFPEIPVQVIQLMSNWYRNEKVHLIDEEDGSHWKIDMDKIIQSVSL